MAVQTDAGVDVSGIFDETNACTAAADIQPGDQLWQKWLRQGEVRRTNTAGVVQHENDVNGTFRCCTYSDIFGNLYIALVIANTFQHIEEQYRYGISARPSVPTVVFLSQRMHNRQFFRIWFRNTTIVTDEVD